MTNLLITCTHLVRHIKDHSLFLKNNSINFKAIAPENQQFNASEMGKLLPGNDYIIAGDDEISSDVIDKSINNGLKAIIKWGIGVDNIDISYAKMKKIPVFNTPNVFGNEVAEQAISLILNLTRGTHLIDKEVRKGNWFKFEGTSLTSKKIGIVGFGSIGKAIAKRASAFEMEVMLYDPYIDQLKNFDNKYKFFDLEYLSSNCDFLVLACSLTKENKHLVDEVFLSRMKNDSYVINVSRGPLIKEDALIAAIINKKIKGAGLDVFEEEPLKLSSKILEVPNCILGSHNSSNTIDAVKRVNKMTLEMVQHLMNKNILNVFPDRLVN